MCFEVPALVPPGGGANGNKSGSYDDDTNDDDLGIMDIDDNDNKAGNHLSRAFIICGQKSPLNSNSEKFGN